MHTCLVTTDSPRLDCQILLAHALGQSRPWLIAHDDYPLSRCEQRAFMTALEHRRNGKPTAYITGIQEFWSLDFRVNESTLIPRPETELLVQTILERYTSTDGVLVDLGTGAGSIAISIANERPGLFVFGSDMNHATLQIAAQNCRRLTKSSVLLVQSDWLAAFSPGQFDIIVSNPPYVQPDDKHLAALRYEPPAALVADDNGLKDIKRILASAARYLKSHGMILLEHGFNQQDAVISLYQQNGFVQVEPLSDFSGQPRAVLAYKP